MGNDMENQGGPVFSYKSLRVKVIAGSERNIKISLYILKQTLALLNHLFSRC
jgi:hypothetical protein